jgi:hypothetical protein
VRPALGADRNAPSREDAPDASGAGSAPTRKSGGDSFGLAVTPRTLQSRHSSTGLAASREGGLSSLTCHVAFRPVPGVAAATDRSVLRLAPRVPPVGLRLPPVPSSSAALRSAKPLEPQPGLLKGTGPALRRPPAGCPTGRRRHRTASTPRESFRGPRTGLWPLAPPKRRSRPENRVHRSARVANPDSALSRA